TRLEDKPVELPVERAQAEPRRREIRREGRLRIRRGLQLALVRELLDETGLGYIGHVRRMTARDRSREHGRQVVPDRLVTHFHVRIRLLEGVDHRLEMARLPSRPHALAGDVWPLPPLSR